MMMSANHAQPLPALLAALTVLASLIALAARLDWPPPALWHLVFATTAMPMIFAAMAYFVPVLTRSGEAPSRLALLPLAALGAGLAIVGWFVSGGTGLRHGAPLAGLLAAAGLALWMRHRRRRCLGGAHPCLAWYQAALGCLTLGLAAVFVSSIWPAQAYRLRLLHLHLNLLGFMGLTAIGTLQVLLPTVLGAPDPNAGRRLRRDLPWSLGGALGIAAGSALWWPLAALAGAAYALPLLRLIADLWRTYGRALGAPGQPAPLLLAAIGGILALLGHGLGHAAGLPGGRLALPAFVIGFLLPLVSGALTQLLPVWLRPGAQADWQRRQRRGLAAFARLRALLLLAGGGLAGAGLPAGYLFGALGAAWLLAVVVRTVLKRRE